MTPPQIDEFLQAPRFAIIATKRTDGAPQLTPVWYLSENGRIYISISVNSAKYRNLSRDRRISICIAAEHPDARAVMIYGTAKLIPDSDPRYEDFEWRLARRYHDSDEEARAFQESLPSEEESALVIVTPDKIIAEDYN
jgi:PPOX class probable F420-dependent enzyme